MKHPIPSLLLIGIAAAAAGGPASAQDCDPAVLACTPPNAMGQLDLLEDAVTDLTYRSTVGEVWAIEGPLPRTNGLAISRFTVYSDDLRTGRRSFNAGFTEPAFGLAEIPPAHPSGGSFLVLSPDASTAAGFNPAIGTMDENGNLLPDGAFKPIIDPSSGAAPPGYFSAIDVHPTEPEIAVLDDGGAGGGAHIVFLDFSFQVIRGPFLIEGRPSFFGGGIAYTSESTVMVVAQFRSSFESRLALEYDRTSGVYTGRTLSLDLLGGLDAPIAMGLDTGFVAGQPALFLYDVPTDAAYGIPFDPALLPESPGPVQGIQPSCTLDEQGRLRLAWTHHPDYDYDQVVVLENGVEVASLDPSTTEYVSTVPAAGKYEYCLETRRAGLPSLIRVCCEGQSGEGLPFFPEGQVPGSLVDVDPLSTNPHFQMGMACPMVVGRKEDFRLYIIGSYDNQVRVVNHARQLLPAETITTLPARQSVVQGSSIRDLAASGIALLDLQVEGQTVPVYALLDNDGPGTFVPRASIHFLKTTTLPGSPTPIPAGTRFQDEISTIDFGPSNLGRYLVDWDADAAGNLITFDSEGDTVMRIRYDPAANTLKVTAEASLPMRTLTPFLGRSFPSGGIAVLPSGNYLLAGGDTFDSTITRVFLVTPFVPLDPSDPESPVDPDLSVKLVGLVEGLVTFSQFFSPDVFGRSVGPGLCFGLETAFFADEPAGVGGGVGAMFYNFPHYFPPGRRGFQGNILASLTSEASSPALEGEPLLDESTTLAREGVYLTDDLSPSFAADVGPLDFHYHVFNPSEASPLHARVKVILDGGEVPALEEPDILLPAGRSLYRRLPGRAERSIRLQVESLAPVNQSLRVLVGATAQRPLEEPPRFRRGDANEDGAVDTSDPISVLQYMFLGGAEPSCLDAADVDDSGVIDLTDPIGILNYLFLAGTPPAPPGPTSCGEDPTGDDSLPPCDSAQC